MKIIYRNSQFWVKSQFLNNNSQRDMTRFNHIHGMIMATAWFGMTNIAVWALRFKYHSLAMSVHMVVGFLVTLITVMGSTIELVKTDFSFDILGDRYYHDGVGTMLVFILPFFMLSGVLCKSYKAHPRTDPQIIHWSTKIHKLMGYAYIVLSRIPLYSGWQPYYQYPTILFILGDTLSFTLLWISKIYEPKLTKYFHHFTNNQNVKQIHNEADLDFYGNEYFIFGNRVFYVHEVIGNHPGGYMIIDKIRKREVDRFVLGQESLQEFKGRGKIYEHSKSCMRLAGQAIAQIKIPSCYSQMSKVNVVSLQFIDRLHAQTEIFILYFKSKEYPFQFRGYSKVQQLGRHYALTADKKITRLYSQVNFLHKTNLQFMKKIFIDLQSPTDHYHNQKKSNHMQMQEEQMSEINNLDPDLQLIPFLIKKYQKGNFTAKYLQDQQKKYVFELSEPLGMGLALSSFPQGRIIILAAGTGIYPFSDLIDLLFKSSFLEKNSQFHDKLIQNDPILKERPFLSQKFQIYYSVRNLYEIHPLTASQLNQLSLDGQIKSIINANNTEQKLLNIFIKKFRNIELKMFRFEQIVQEIVRSQYAVILICGPSRVTQSIVHKLHKLEVSANKYRII